MCMYVFILMCVGFYLSMHVCWCMCILVYVYMRVYMYVYACILWSAYVYEGMFVWVHVFGCVLQRFGSIWWDPNPATGDPDPIQIRARCGPNTMAIRRSTHEMIHRSVPVHAVKTRRRFGSETASFHVSVRYCVFTVVGMPYMLLLSFHVTFCYILPVWSLVLLHEISMIAHFIHVVDICLY